MHEETMQPSDIHQVIATAGHAPELQEVRLGEVCRVQTGPFGSQLHASDYRAHGTPIITVEHLGDNRIIHENVPLVSDDDLQRLTRYQLHAGDIVFSRVGAIDRRALVTNLEHGWLFSGRCLRVRPRQDTVHPGFLAHYLGLPQVKNWILNHSVGSTMACLNTDIPLRLPLTLPLLALQLRIAAVLDTVDEEIAKTEAVIAKLKQVRAGLLHDLLTRGLDEHGQLRDPIAHPEQFQDSPLGCIPRVWQCKTLEEAADWYSGGTPSRSQVAWWQGDVPILTPKDMKVFELSDTIEHVTEEAAQMGSKVMPASTAFIVVRGMILAHTFPVCLSTRPLAFNQDIKAVCGRGELSTRFLAHWFAANSALFLRKATEATHGTKKLDSDELHRIRIAIPSPEEQQAIVKWIETIDANIAVESDKHAKLGLVKSGLMSDLLTGRVRVPEGIAVAS